MASKLEQETIINFNAAESNANIFSTEPSMIKKIMTLGGKPYQDGPGYEVNVPKAWIKIVPPRVYSQEALENKREAVKKARKARAAKSPKASK